METTELLTADNGKFIEQYEALQRLEQNEDFKILILDGYLKTNALDSVSLLARPDIKKRNERGDVMEDLISVSNLRYYFDMVTRLGQSALYDKIEGDLDD